MIRGILAIGLDPDGHAQGMTGAVACWHIDDKEKTLRSLLDAGAQSLQSPKDVGEGKLVAMVKDAEGNLIGLVQEPS